MQGRQGAVSLSKRSARWLVGVTYAALWMMCAIVGFVLLDSRREVSRDIMAAAANLATAVAHDVDRNIEMLDLSMQAVAEQWTNPAVQTLDPNLRNMVLFDKSTSANDFGLMIVIDDKGKVQTDSKTQIPVGTSFADRDYFRVHVTNADVGLFVSKPYISRIDGNWHIGLSRRIAGRDGHFVGVVLASLELSYFKKLYSALNTGQGGTITLFRTDGRIVTREPYVETDVRRSIGDSAIFQTMRSSRSGSVEGASPIDGQNRIISYHRVGQLPLIQDIEVSSDEAYGLWWRKTAIVGAVLVCFAVLSTILLRLLGSELARRIKAEDELLRLATTDTLTGLANRRGFERAWAEECALAGFGPRTSSLLMIDADSFKAYNDAFGHPAGDELLRKLAACIAASVRPGDLACRYGGEEFVVLLPETGDGRAYDIAETIRAAVQTLNQPNPGSPNGLATVSIGIATLALSVTSAASAVEAADAALYRAKTEGRNRCVAASAMGLPKAA